MDPTNERIIIDMNYIIDNDNINNNTIIFCKPILEIEGSREDD